VQEFALPAELAVAIQADWTRSCYELREHALRVLQIAAGESLLVLSPEDGVPQILAVSFPGYEGAVLMRLLAEMDVVVGAGSACHAESAETSHVLKAMGVSKDVARGQLRISFGRETRGTDVDRLGEALSQVLRNY
jgi:cysteine desulfurase